MPEIENIKDYQKAYREANRAHLYVLNKSWRLKNNAKTLCTCGRTVVKTGLTKHLKTPMHTRYLDKLAADIPVEC